VLPGSTPELQRLKQEWLAEQAALRDDA